MTFKPFLCAFSLLACGLSTSATAIPTLTLTEKSSTELLWSWEGPGGPISGDVSAVADDNWEFLVPAVNPITDTLVANWVEQNPPEGLNQVLSSWAQNQLQVTVRSDLPNVPVGHVNGEQVLSLNGSYSIVFFDLGDDGDQVVGTPEAGNSATLLVVALGALTTSRSLRVRTHSTLG